MDFAFSVYLDEEAAKRANKLAAEREAAAQGQRLVVERLASALAKLAGKDLNCQIADELPEAFRRLQHDFNSVVTQLAAALSRRQPRRRGRAFVLQGDRDCVE